MTILGKYRRFSETMMSRLLLSASVFVTVTFIFVGLPHVLEASDPDSYSGVSLFEVPFIGGVEKKYPKLDSTLNQVLIKGNEAIRELPVDIFFLGDEQDLRLYIESHQGTVISVSDGRMEAVVSAGLLIQVSFLEDVSFIRTLPSPSLSQTSAGISLIRSDVWNTAGYTGAGIKVGVLDGGFQGLSNLSGTELPSNVQFRCYSGYSYSTEDVSYCETNTGHGTAVSELITDVAPDIELYVSNPVISRGIFREAVEWMVSEGVGVINHSGGWVWDGPGDGTSLDSYSPLVTVDYATSNDVVWVNSAGNENGNTWTGEFGVGPTSGLHYFDASYNYNPVYVSRNKNVIIQLRWEDSWLSPSSDLNLYLFDPTLSTYVDRSIDLQAGSTYQVPWEYLSYKAGYSGYYNVVIQHVSGPVPDWVQVQVFAGNDLAINTSGHSISNPAESASPGLLAVGAASVDTPSIIQTYSSRGPTTDGRTKPDIVSYDQVVTSSWSGNFPGTSASAPHVAGLAALVRDQFHSYGAEDVAYYLKSNAELMDGNVDNIWGYGKAQLPFLTPKEPLNVSLNADGNTVTVSWEPPAYDGGSEVSGYRIFVNPGNVSQLVGANTLFYEANDLVYDRQYEFVVAAVNGEGEGDSSQPVFTTVVNTGCELSPSPSLFTATTTNPYCWS